MSEHEPDEQIPEEYDEESDIREETKRERERQDKSWPPSTMETKVPRATGRK